MKLQDRIALLLLIFFTQNINSQSVENLIQIPSTLYINNIYHSEISLFINSKENIFIEKKLLLNIIQNNVEESELVTLQLGNNEHISINEIDKTGITANHIPEELALKIHIPYKMRKINTIDILNTKSNIKKELIKPMDFSTYLNVLGSQYIDNDQTITGTYTLENIINYRQWVLETTVPVDFTEGITPPDISLKHKFEIFDITLGSYSNSITGFQSSTKNQGIEITSKEASKSNKSLSFLIEEKSEADVFINGRKVKTVILDPGHYNLSNFPYNNGLNSMDLKIRTSSNKEYEINYFLPLNSSTINKGDFDYYYSIGIHHWESDLFNITGSHSYGLTDFLTLNGNFQVENFRTLLGINLITATKVGNFYFNNGYSMNYENDFTNGYGCSLGYIWNNNIKKHLPIVGINLQYETEDFNNTEGSIKRNYEVSTTVTKNIYKKLNGSLQANYKKSYDSEYNILTGLKLNYTFKNSISVNLNLKTNFPDPDLDKSYLSLTFNFIDNSNSMNMNYSQDFAQNSQNIDISKSFLDKNMRLSSNIESNQFFIGNYYNVDNSLNYKGDRFTSSANMHYYSDKEESNYNFGLNIGFAFAYTSGHFGVTKPISNSFLFVIPQHALLGEDIGVNFNGESYLATSDIFGPALVSDLGSDIEKQITVELLNQNSKNFISDNIFNINPTYKSGSVIYTGNKKEIILHGKLFDQDNNPLIYAVGTVNDNNIKLDFFTDENGDFYIYGLEAGKYFIDVSGYEQYKISVVTMNQETTLNTEIKLNKEENN